MDFRGRKYASGGALSPTSNKYARFALQTTWEGEVSSEAIAYLQKRKLDICLKDKIGPEAIEYEAIVEDIQTKNQKNKPRNLV